MLRTTRLAVICHLLGLLLILFGLTLLAPLLIALIDRDGAAPAFMLGLVIATACGCVLWAPSRGAHTDLRTRDGFVIATLFWVVLGIFGALPFLLVPEPRLDLGNAVFESVSGLTTTGATVIDALDKLPRSVLYYRQQLQWLGGIGTIVIAVAILPMLGVGGMQLYQAETPGAMKGNKLTPRILGTAGQLFLIYLVLTVCCGLAYWFAGMSVFDAVAHSFSTISVGGFSTHDANMGHFDNPLILVISIVFMVLAALNFALHYLCWRQRSLRFYASDPEARFFLAVIAVLSVLTAATLLGTGSHGPADGALQGVFHVVSVVTTTGFTTGHFLDWPAFAPLLLLLFACMGGCGGSTAGGIKAVRILLIGKQGLRELRQLVHPRAILPVRLGSRTIPDRVIIAVWSFLAVYVVTFLVILFALLLSGLDFLTAFSAVAATLNNLGPGLGEVALHYVEMDAPVKWLLCLSMLLGRLEIFSLLVLFTPAFWRD